MIRRTWRRFVSRFVVADGHREPDRWQGLDDMLRPVAPNVSTLLDLARQGVAP